VIGPIYCAGMDLSSIDRRSVWYTVNRRLRVRCVMRSAPRVLKRLSHGPANGSI